MMDIEKVKDLINKFDPSNKGSVILLAVVMCVLFVPIFKSINSTFIEVAFMKPKEIEKNGFFKLIALLVILAPVNFVLSMDHTFFIMELLLGLIGIVLYIVYDRKKVLTEKYEDSPVELNTYYQRKCSNSFLFIIISITPGCSILMNTSANYISPFNCAVIVSVIEVFIICFCIPELISHESCSYFIIYGKEVYIYKRIDADTILCGDNPKINKSKEHMIISYEDLKKKEIFYVQYANLSKERKRKLIKEYKKKRSVGSKKNIMNEDDQQ